MLVNLTLKLKVVGSLLKLWMENANPKSPVPLEELLVFGLECESSWVGWLMVCVLVCVTS